MSLLFCLLSSHLSYLSHYLLSSPLAINVSQCVRALVSTLVTAARGAHEARAPASRRRRGARRPPRARPLPVRCPSRADAGRAVRRAPVRSPVRSPVQPSRADAGAPSLADVGAPCHTPVVRSPVRLFVRSFVRPFARSPVLRTRAHAGGQCGQRAAGAAGGSAVAGSIRWWHTCRARGGRAGAQISPRCASFARGSPRRSGGMGAFACRHRPWRVGSRERHAVGLTTRSWATVPAAVLAAVHRGRRCAARARVGPGPGAATDERRRSTRREMLCQKCAHF